MVVCTNCRHPEILGALFCSECGHRLDAAEGLPTDSFDPPLSGRRDEGLEGGGNIATAGGGRVMLFFYQHQAYIRLDENRDYSLGRINDGQSVLPDIDLSAYEGYKNGVSRVHASIQISPRRINVVDLGSSNGTFLNGRRLTPQVPYSMADGDILILGKLEARVEVNPIG
ncbi:MAG TPA: FHA domain-containing protein [Anaerolineales bacterium]|nr:FHA domain-containing protein [Anaerolineales bacterium]